MKDRTVITANTVNEAVEKVRAEYIRNDVCIGEFLDTIEINGLSVEQVVNVYALLYKEIEGDKIYRIDEDGMIYSVGFEGGRA